ncbi:uncharacterized protein I303_101062 [Kwoniella dejecticola CBS 10117]|uniref:CENP-V/GFA domain-containing protein n=1 Tax=Kwoniella dejecticola CBS 10117 TaxID=1296121 RepID=A0A1A6AGP1_9TREE|nr:uncharacterized protein I303_01065 [Kwoniella dejecticola CBS 10117]OBR89240.1 hypothetical protein I303_01065 [Kwoniella dejecticola CBS 10117]
MSNNDNENDNVPDTVRPPTKRVRSDQDHSKASTKAAEASKDSESKDEDMKEENHEDDEWLKQPPFSVGADKEGWETKWRESCWCGKVAFVYNDDPSNSKICHCEDCQRLHGAPYQHSVIFHKKNVRLDSDASPEWLGFLSAHGEVHPLSSTPTPLPRKISCRACGSNLMDEGRNMIMAFPPCFEWTRTHKEVDKAKQNDAKKENDGDNANSDAPGVNRENGGKGKKGKKGNHGSEGDSGKGARKQQGFPDELRAQCHIFYERRCVDVKDGLPKWRGHKEQSDLMGEDEK